MKETGFETLRLNQERLRLELVDKTGKNRCGLCLCGRISNFVLKFLISGCRVEHRALGEVIGIAKTESPHLLLGIRVDSVLSILVSCGGVNLTAGDRGGDAQNRAPAFFHIRAGNIIFAHVKVLTFSHHLADTEVIAGTQRIDLSILRIETVT